MSPASMRGMLTQSRHFYSRELCEEKVGGFHRRFPLYRTETHLCGCQKGEPRRCKHRNQKTKRKTFMKDQNIMFTSVLVAIACFALSPTATAGRPRPSPTPSSEDRGNNNSAAERRCAQHRYNRSEQNR